MSSGDDRSVLRIVGIGLLILLLGTSVAGANAAVAADRTVLSAEFVKSTLQEEDAYEPIRADVVDAASEELALNGSMGGLPIDAETLAEEAIPPAYVGGQVEANVDRVYGYLHGERETLEVAVDLVPVKENVADAVESQVRNASTRELFLAVAGDEPSITIQGVTVDLVAIAGMAESREAYRETRTAFKADVREVVVNRAVNGTFRSASDDQLLALVIEDYDPRAYTAAEKERMVADREAEIRALLRERLEERPELNESVDEQLNATRGELKTHVRESVREDAGAVDPALAEPSADLAAVWVDGLTAEQSYETFSERVEANKTRLAAAVGDVVRTRLDEEAPDTLDLTGEMDASTRNDLETARTAVGAVGWLVYLLPVLALALVGALWFVTRSPTVTGVGAGIGVLLGSVPLYVAAALVPARVQAGLRGGDVPPSVADVVVGFVRQGAAVLAEQSLALVAIGVVLIAAGAGYYLYEERRTAG